MWDEPYQPNFGCTELELWTENSNWNFKLAFRTWISIIIIFFSKIIEWTSYIMIIGVKLSVEVPKQLLNAWMNKWRFQVHEFWNLSYKLHFSNSNLFQFWLFWSGEPFETQYKHSVGFSRDDNCPVDVTSEGDLGKSCCGFYRKSCDLEIIKSKMINLFFQTSNQIKSSLFHF